MNLKDPKYMYVLVFVSISLCFLIKFLGMIDAIPWSIGYSDVGPYYAVRLKDAGMPYIDRPLEYPVVIGMVMFLSSRFSQTFYYWFHYLVFLGCGLVSTYYLLKLSKKITPGTQWLWPLSLTLLWFSYYNWDIIAVMFSLMALCYFEERKDILASILLGLGIATKMYPAVFLLGLFFHRKILAWIKIGMIAFLTFLAANFYFIYKNFPVWIMTYTFHGGREPNIDSIWYWFMRWFGLSIPLINILTLAFFLGLIIYFTYKNKSASLTYLSFLGVMIFLLTNKVFSPQFLLWIIPFFALFGGNITAFYLLEASNVLVLFSTITHIMSKLDFTTSLITSGAFVFIRHALLIYLFAELIRTYRLSSSAQQPSSLA